MESKKCPQCGKEFEGRANKIYCSLTCKMIAFKNAEKRSNNGYETDMPVFKSETDAFCTETNKFQQTSCLTSVPERNENAQETVSIRLSRNEKEYLEEQANACGTSLSHFIRVLTISD